VQVGGGNIQINLYAESRSVVWPHQMGAVPLLADCYQHRQQQAAELDEAASTGTVVLTQVLSGLGGVGKTQVAAGYARRVWAQGGVELLVWATASSRVAVQETYAQVATEIGQFPTQDVERAAEWFLGWLQTTSRRWLVVLDDLADPTDLKGLWPTGPSGRTVVTTRRRDTVLSDRGRRLIDIGLYTAAEALAYLEDKLRRSSGEVRAEAAGLAADLGYLPLALAQAATFIHDRGETCAGYRRRLDDRRRRLSDILPEDALADDYRSTVAATWSISVDRADKLPPVGLARPLLQLISTLDPNGLPLDIVTSSRARAFIVEQRASSVSDGPAAMDEKDYGDALSNLHRLNLISLDRTGGARAIRTHALVQRATMECLSTDAVSTTVRAAADALAQVWPDIERDTELGRVLRNCAASLRERHDEVLWRPQGHAVLFYAGYSLGECGLATAAVDYWTEMVTEATAVLGPDHPQTLTTRQSLARWRGQAGKPVRAAAEFEALLPDYLRVLGPNHPDTLATRHGLAWWRGEARDPVGAVADLAALLADRIRVLGRNHLQTLTTRYSLGRWRGQAGDPKGAVAEFKALFPDSLRLMGPDHPLTLAVRHDLAWWLGEAGDSAAGVEAFETLLTDRLRVMGPDHPHTLATRHDLGWWWGEAGDPAGAAAILEALLPDYLRLMGPQHPHALATREDLAWWRADPDVRRRGPQGQVRDSTDRVPGDLPGLDFLPPGYLWGSG
jgi:hypothetical protein